MYELIIMLPIGSATYYTNLAEKLLEVIENKRTIVYVDFGKDVAPLTIALNEKGVNSCGYHGKKMSIHDKVKAVGNWCPANSTIQVRAHAGKS